MDSALAVTLVAGTALGVALCLWLRTGRYRRPTETAPLPSHLWVVPATPFVGMVIAAALAGRPWPVLLPYLLLVPAGLALAAIDADVHRLPNAITLPLVPLELALLTAASAATSDWAALGRALLAGLVVGGGLLLIALVLHGRSIGVGDAKLVLSLAPALGWLSWLHVLGGLWLGFVLGGLLALVLLISRRADRRSRLAFGPHLVAGALLAVTLG